MAIEINKGIEAFDERTDFSRNNPDRKPWGKGGVDGLDLRGEYDTPAPPQPTPPAPTIAPVVEETKKFTHKLKDGTVLEAPTIDELAALIEKAVTKAPEPPAEFEDKPLYQPLEFKRKELSLQEQANILNVWKENPQKALRMLEEAEYGVPMDTILQTLGRVELRELNRMQEIAAVEFMEECDTYNATPANGKKLTEHLKAKGKPITKQNLVLSFKQLVAAGDKALLRQADEPTTESAAATEELTEVPPPPVVVPSNLGLPEEKGPGQVDVAKFASMSLADQKKFFTDLRRRQ